METMQRTVPKGLGIGLSNSYRLTSESPKAASALIDDDDDGDDDDDSSAVGFTWDDDSGRF
jgi:hypothetical protein